MATLGNIVVIALSLAVALVVSALALNFFGIHGYGFAGVCVRGATGITAVVLALMAAQHLSEKLRSRARGNPRSRPWPFAQTAQLSRFPQYNFSC